jgi:hypothetical protein
MDGAIGADHAAKEEMVAASSLRISMRRRPLLARKWCVPIPPTPIPSYVIFRFTVMLA